MGALETFNVGLVGACGRGGSFRAGVEATGVATVHAVCDINADGLEQARECLGAAEAYTDYEQMLDDSDLDAVVVGTPMPLHVPQSIVALDRGLHVLSEVPAAVSVDQCRELVAACKRADATYMMAENMCYLRPVMVINELVRRGLFGDLYYAEGEYLHELKELNEVTRWRRRWQTGIEGITYGTHSLGPILMWMAGDRVVRVCCEGSGQHHVDPRGEPYAQDTSVMLCKTARGALIKIRVDMLSDRPHGMNNYMLQGTRGAYESGRGGLCDQAKVWLADLCSEMTWMSPDDLGDEYLPQRWRETPDAAQKAGHGGGDYFEIIDFIDAATGKQPCPIGIHQAMDMTLPGLVSQQSILEGGRWLDVPDSRQW